MKTFLLALVLTAPIFAQDAPANITLYRPHKIRGIGFRDSIYLDGVVIERSHNGTVFNATIPPGQHMLMLGKSEAGLFLNFESGKHYFFKFVISGNNLTTNTPIKLVQVSEDQAARESQQLKQLPVVTYSGTSL